MDGGDHKHILRADAKDEDGLDPVGGPHRDRATGRGEPKSGEHARTSEPMSERLHWSFSLGSLPESHAALRQLVREDLDRLSDQLAIFAPEAVRLHIDAVAARPDPSRKVTLRLAIPDHLLRVEAFGHDLAAAVRKAFARLLRRLGRVKAKLRGEPFWKQKWRRYRAGQHTAQFDEGVPRDEGGRTPADLERLWDDASAELSAYARRVLRSAEEPAGGRLQDEQRATALLAESRGRLAQSSGEVPESISTRAGFYRALRDRLNASCGEAPPTRERTDPGPATPCADLPAAIDGPALHRDVFQLYFREGFEDFEIAWILGQPLAKVRRAIADLNQNLRSILVCGGDDAVLLHALTTASMRPDGAEAWRGAPGTDRRSDTMSDTSASDAETFHEQSQMNWGWIALRGVLALAFGILALLMPEAAVLAMAIVYGVFAFVDGIFMLVAAVRRKPSNWPGWALALGGVLGIAAGVIVVLTPFLAAIALVIFTWIAVSVWALTTGALEISAAARLHKETTTAMWLALSGFARALLGVAAAILLLMFPLASIPALGLALGAFGLASGLTLLMMAYRLRREASRAPSAAAPPVTDSPLPDAPSGGS
jgi:uncharacterized membrane protein HdeD (DUF308 family)/ribosome-associated translation inhibitor RaiA